jgi:Ca-activated chloride channel family protein
VVLGGPRYLPLVSARACRLERTASDVVLVLDVSTTMLSPGPDGRPKLDLAAAAARAFVGDLAAAPDRVGLVAFAEQAWVAAALSRDRDAVRSALLALTARRGSRIDLGLDLAGQALAGSPPQVGRVVVLLSDGHPVGSQRADVARAADRLRAAGVTVYAVGLGPDADEALLRQLAGAPERYLDAGVGEHLERVYRDLAARLRCS